MFCLMFELDSTYLLFRIKNKLEDFSDFTNVRVFVSPNRKLLRNQHQRQFQLEQLYR